MTLNKRLYTPEEMADAVTEIASAIISDCRDAGEDDYALCGLHEQGVFLAERLCGEIEKATGRRPMLGKLDISMYRDDFGQRSALPLIRETEIPFDVNGMRIILVDDVLSTGRTIRAALDALTDYGRPGIIRLAVLIDRGSPEFPVRADYIGMHCSPPAGHKIKVCFSENPAEEGVYEIEWKS